MSMMLSILFFCMGITCRLPEWIAHIPENTRRGGRVFSEKVFRFYGV
jgi:hypothetical protein